LKELIADQLGRIGFVLSWRGASTAASKAANFGCYWLFGELPDKLVYLGAAIVTAAGLFVIWRERQLGLKRAREAEGPPQAA
jgi:hypothetical protein